MRLAKTLRRAAALALAIGGFAVAPSTAAASGPVLVVSDGGFGDYYAEILRAEGLNAFNLTNSGALSAAGLAPYDVVVLAQTDVSPAQAAALSTWVQGGGNLVAMRPDADLAGLLGLGGDAGELSEAYIGVNTGSAAGAGITGATMQFHGTADRYAGASASTVATLFSSSGTSTGQPAVTLRSVGSAGGQAAAFAYDLARSVVYTRQGNPAWAGLERDGTSPTRSDDLFFPGDWVDPAKIHIPQADEQQRLLANLITQMNLDRAPLPRFWYLPRGESAAVVMTGDDHEDDGGTEGQFEEFKRFDPAGCAPQNWECVRATSYVFPNRGGALTNADALGYQNQGFEVALHHNTDCSNASDLAARWTDQLSAFRAQWPNVAAPVTNRTHCMAWNSWVDTPRAELNQGIGLDTNYYYWPAAWVQDRPGLFTGSGFPMRFADTDGSLVDVYQAATQLTDESGINYATHIKALIDRALNGSGYYGVFTANMHTDAPTHEGADAIVGEAVARGVPVITSAQLLDWTEGRNSSQFQNVAYGNGLLRFTVAPGAGARGLEAMLPASAANGALNSLTRNGEQVARETRTVKGITYHVFAAAAGNYEATYGPTRPDDTSAPVTTDDVPSSVQPGPVIVTLAAVDEAGGSGVEKTFYTTDGSAPSTSSAVYDPAAKPKLADAQRIRYFSRDRVGNVELVKSSPVVHIDDTAPQTTIDAGMPDVTDSTTAIFAFSSSEPGSAFQCQIDGTSWHGCSSPATYGSLANGLHVFSVRATDVLGNTDATEATRIFMVRATSATTAPPVATPSPKPSDQMSPSPASAQPPSPTPAPSGAVAPSFGIPAKGRRVPATSAGRVTVILTGVTTSGTGRTVLKTRKRFRVPGTDRRRTMVLGSKDFALSAGKDARVQIRLTTRARRLLRTARTVRVNAVISVRAANGASDKRTVSFTISAPRRTR